MDRGTMSPSQTLSAVYFLHRLKKSTFFVVVPIINYNHVVRLRVVSVTVAAADFPQGKRTDVLKKNHHYHQKI